MVARDGVERFRVACYQQLADSTMDTKDREDKKAISCVRFVCGRAGDEAEQRVEFGCSTCNFRRWTLIPTNVSGWRVTKELCCQSGVHDPRRLRAIAEVRNASIARQLLVQGESSTVGL